MAMSITEALEIIAAVILVPVILVSALCLKGDLSTSLSVWRVFQFKLDVKEK